jgi:hypothetical protein
MSKKEKPKEDRIPRCADCGIICSSGDGSGILWDKMRPTHDLICATCSKGWNPTYRPRKEVQA